MAGCNFVLPIPTLTSLAVNSVVTSMWISSLQNHDWTYSEYGKRLSKDLINEFLLEHKLAIARFSRISPHFRNAMNELDIRLAAEITNFLYYRIETVPDIHQFLIDNIVFTMRGSVNYGESIRAALPLIENKRLRFKFVCKYALLDLMDDAWRSLPFSDIKDIMDLWEKRPINWVSNECQEPIFVEIYFAMRYMNKLSDLKAGLLSLTPYSCFTVTTDYGIFEEAPEKLLAWTAFKQDLAELTNYSLTLIPAANRFDMRREFYSHLQKFSNFSWFDDPARMRQTLSMYANFLSGLSREDVLQSSFTPGELAELITPWVESVQHLPLVTPILCRFQDSTTALSYFRVMEVFGNSDFEDCHERQLVLLEVLELFYAKFDLNTELANNTTWPRWYEMMLGLMRKYDHEVAVGILRGVNEDVAMRLMLEFCKGKLIQHKSNHTYVYHKFLDDVVPVARREEFIRRLES